jgi:hypothetical protein
VAGAVDSFDCGRGVFVTGTGVGVATFAPGASGVAGWPGMFSAGRVGVARRGRCVLGAGEAEGSGLRRPDCANVFEARERRRVATTKRRAARA